MESRMIVFEVAEGELVDELNRHAAEAGVTDAAIVSLVRGADSFSVSTLAEGDALKDTITKYNLPQEMTGSPRTPRGGSSGRGRTRMYWKTCTSEGVSSAS
jgi:hypothetical protein